MENGVEFLECAGKRIRQAPHSSAARIPRTEVLPMLNRSHSRSRFILPPFTYARRRGWLKNGNPTGDPSTAPRWGATRQTLNLEFRIVSDTADWKQYEREIEDQFRNEFVAQRPHYFLRWAYGYRNKAGSCLGHPNTLALWYSRKCACSSLKAPTFNASGIPHACSIPRSK